MKQLTIVNQSHGIVLCRLGQPGLSVTENAEDARKELSVILPSVAVTVKVKNFAVPLTLTPQHVSEKKSQSVDEKWSINPDGFSIRMPMAMGALVKVIPVPDDCPWRIYRSKVCMQSAGHPSSNFLTFLSRYLENTTSFLYSLEGSWLRI